MPRSHRRTATSCAPRDRANLTAQRSAASPVGESSTPTTTLLPSWVSVCTCRPVVVSVVITGHLLPPSCLSDERCRWSVRGNRDPASRSGQRETGPSSVAVRRWLECESANDPQLACNAERAPRWGHLSLASDPVSCSQHRAGREGAGRASCPCRRDLVSRVQKHFRPRGWGIPTHCPVTGFLGAAWPATRPRVSSVARLRRRSRGVPGTRRRSGRRVPRRPRCGRSPE